MINKTGFLIVAALAVGPVPAAWALDTVDPNTGLESNYFYAPLHELDAMGMPMKDSAMAYMKKYPHPTAAKRRSVPLFASPLDAFGMRTQVQTPQRRSRPRR